MKQLRLDKYLSDMSVETRSRLKQMIRYGQVSVNGVPARKPEMKVTPGEDTVTVRGEEIVYREREYYMLYKPAGVVTAVTDRKEKTVMDLLPGVRRSDLSPVGRLDRDTEGLLLITNDGALSHRLLSPKHHVEKVYYAEIEGEVTEEDCLAFREGLDIGDETLTLPAKLEILPDGDEAAVKSAQADDAEDCEIRSAEPKSRVKVTVTEGRFHQIKRMFEARQKRVAYLKRLSMGPLALNASLKKGEWRRLTPEETAALTGGGKE